MTSNKKLIKNKTNFQELKNQFTFIHSCGLILPLVPITIGYGMVVHYFLKGIYPIELLVTGITGGLWSLVIYKGYENYRLDISKTQKNVRCSGYGRAKYNCNQKLFVIT